MQTQAVASGLSPAGQKPEVFFYWLIPATLIPFALFPLFAYLWPDRGAIHQSRELLLFIGSQAHVAASFFFYSDTAMLGFMSKHKLRFALAPLVLVLGTAILYSRFEYSELSYFAIAYWIWQTYHYARQNHGILAFVSKAEGMGVDRRERIAIELTGISGCIGMITFVTPYEGTILAPYATQIHGLALVVYVFAWGFAAAAFRNHRGSPLRNLFLLMMMLFYAPLFIYDDPLAAVSSYAIAHGLQYLIFMSYVAATPRPKRVIHLGKLAAFAAVGGALLYTLAINDPVFGSWRKILFGGYLGIVMWHFVLDGGVWKLSQPFQRGYMAERFACLRVSREA